MSDRVREAIQELLNGIGDGWTVTQYVVAMGLEKIAENGEVESVAWYYTPPEQADWQTVGLLRQTCDMHYDAAFEDEEDE